MMRFFLPDGGFLKTVFWLTVGIKEWSGKMIKRSETITKKKN